MPKKTATITMDEITFLVALVAKLDPDNYVNNEIKALIYKAKDLTENAYKYDRVRVIT